jgi:hypothetical protein
MATRKTEVCIAACECQITTQKMNFGPTPTTRHQIEYYQDKSLIHKKVYETNEVVHRQKNKFTGAQIINSQQINTMMMDSIKEE